MIIEKVIHGKYFFYEDTISGKVLKAVYKDYGTMFSTLVVYEISEKKKWNIFGFKFGPLVEYDIKLFNSRDIDLGPVINKRKNYDIDYTLNLIENCLKDWRKKTLQILEYDKVVHSEFLGNKKLTRDRKIDNIIK
jgi:hypothetical protein